MNVQEWLSYTKHELLEANINLPYVDTLVLIEDCLGRDRSWILAHPEFELTQEQVKLLSKQIERRSLHEPLAYIRKRTEFYGRDFYINSYVLEPRPESETIIDLLKSMADHADIIDVGTGSGALAITAKLELPQNKVIAIDIDGYCLQVAKKNAQSLGTNIQFLKGDLLQPLSSLKLSNYVLLCNLPYVPDHFKINKAASYEPSLALFGGPDGLEVYRKLFDQLMSFNYTPKLIITESLPEQHEKLAGIARDHNFELRATNDFVQAFSCAVLG